MKLIDEGRQAPQLFVYVFKLHVTQFKLYYRNIALLYSSKIVIFHPTNLQAIFDVPLIMNLFVWRSRQVGIREQVRHELLDVISQKGAHMHEKGRVFKGNIDA